MNFLGINLVDELLKSRYTKPIRLSADKIDRGAFCFQRRGAAIRVSFF